MNEIRKSETLGTRQCVKFRALIFKRHYPIAGELAGGFLRNAVAPVSDRRQYEREIERNASGNRWLFAVDKKLNISEKSPRSVVLDMQDCEDLANVAAKNTKRAIDSAMLGGLHIEKQQARKNKKREGEFLIGLEAGVFAARERLERHGIDWPVSYPIDKKTGCIKHTEKTRADEVAALARAACPIWWRRNIKKNSRRKVEGVLREAGAVARKRSPYVSDWGLEQWMNSQRSNNQLLSAMVATSDEGDEVSLLDCVKSSVSNPVNRRNELMTRIRGFEEVCDSMKLQGVLLTLTAPSGYHAYHAESGKPVSNFNKKNPRQVMDYLCGVWSRIRAQWHREKIKTVGFRVCEPHHDGTPHFHFLLWFAPQEIDAAWGAFESHALSEDGDESGAKRHRCSMVKIDREKGSAAGYVAKYVSKNIDGFGFGASERDDDAQIDAASGSLRARAWASIWGIRQFQQIGSVSVTVYRELRRIKESMALEPEEVQEAHAAADDGDWARFLKVMGGVFVNRLDQLLKPVYEICEKIGRYGEEIKRLSGLGLRRLLAGYVREFIDKYYLKTRLKNWTVSVDLFMIKKKIDILR